MRTAIQFHAIIFFFFNDTATTEIYTLSLHDALPILAISTVRHPAACPARTSLQRSPRSEEHTSELQSRGHLVCRLLLEKKTQIEVRFAYEQIRNVTTALDRL